MLFKRNRNNNNRNPPSGQTKLIILRERNCKHGNCKENSGSDNDSDWGTKKKSDGEKKHRSDHGDRSDRGDRGEKYSHRLFMHF